MMRKEPQREAKDRPSAYKKSTVCSIYLPSSQEGREATMTCYKLQSLTPHAPFWPITMVNADEACREVKRGGVF